MSFEFPDPEPLARQSDLAPARATYARNWAAELKVEIIMGFHDKTLSIRKRYDANMLSDHMSKIMRELQEKGYEVETKYTSSLRDCEADWCMIVTWPRISDAHAQQ